MILYPRARKLLTRAHGSCGAGDSGRISGRAGGACTVVDGVTEVRHAAQAVHIIGSAGKRARIVEGSGVALLLSGCQLCLVLRTGLWFCERLTPQGSRLSIDCALAKAARESRAKGRIPTMVTKTDRNDRIHGVNEWSSTGKSQGTAPARHSGEMVRVEDGLEIWLNKATEMVCQKEERWEVCWVFVTIQMETYGSGE